MRCGGVTQFTWIDTPPLTTFTAAAEVTATALPRPAEPMSGAGPRVGKCVDELRILLSVHQGVGVLWSYPAHGALTLGGGRVDRGSGGGGSGGHRV